MSDNTHNINYCQATCTTLTIVREHTHNRLSSDNIHNIKQAGIELGLNQVETVSLELWIHNEPPIFAERAIKL